MPITIGNPKGWRSKAPNSSATWRPPSVVLKGRFGCPGLRPALPSALAPTPVTRPPLPLPLGARRVCRPLRGGGEWVTLSMPVTPSGRWLVVYMRGRCSREQVKWGCCTPTPLGPTGPAVSALKPFSPGAGRAAGLSPGGHDVLTPPPGSHSAFQKSPQAGALGLRQGRSGPWAPAWTQAAQRGNA